MHSYGQVSGKLLDLERVEVGMVFTTTPGGPALTATALPVATAVRNQVSVAVTGGTSPYVASRKSAVKLV